MAPPRLLVVMGSGETAESMVAVHRAVLSRLPPEALLRLVDTPYGFQDNADDITRRTRNYFGHNVGREVQAISLRDVGSLSPAHVEMALAEVDAADWLFAGPGSPTYLLRQWTATALPDVLTAKLRHHGVLVFASAAACVLGSRTAPVYEIYKVGERPHWVDGLDLVRVVGLDAAVIPHFDNGEGGSHDTRYCYLGEHRLAQLEAQLGGRTCVLGVDEHTAAVFDLDADSLRVVGRGVVTVRIARQTATFRGDAEIPLDDLRRAAGQDRQDARSDDRSAPPAGDAATTSRTTGTAGADGAAAPDPEQAFDVAVAGRDAVAAADAVLTAEAAAAAQQDGSALRDDEPRRRTLRRLITRLAGVAEGGLHDHHTLLAPVVDALVELRERARAEQRYDDADIIRDRLRRAGVEVHDTPDGTTWTHEERR